MIVHLIYSVVIAGMTVSCDQRGAVNIIGIETEYFIAGRLEICDGTVWRAVYHGSWGTREAKLVCTQREFPAESNMHLSLLCAVNT